MPTWCIVSPWQYFIGLNVPLVVILKCIFTKTYKEESEDGCAKCESDSLGKVQRRWKRLEVAPTDDVARTRTCLCLLRF